MFLHCLSFCPQGGVSQYAMGQAGGGVYPSMQWARQGGCIFQNAMGQEGGWCVSQHAIGQSGVVKRAVCILLECILKCIRQSINYFRLS